MELINIFRILPYVNKNRIEDYHFILKAKQDRLLISPTARYLDNTKFPNKFSESLIAHMILEEYFTLEEGPVSGVVVTNNNKMCDIVVEISKEKYLRVEAKGTGAAKFITMGAKDYKADYLFWMWLDSENQCTILKYAKPETLTTRSKRMTLKEFYNNHISENLTEKHFSLETLLL